MTRIMMLWKSSDSMSLKHIPYTFDKFTFKSMVGEIIISISYGLQVLPHGDPYITAAKEAIHVLSMAAVPGTFLVDSLPFLKYVPEWVPGAGFKKKAREFKKMARKMIEAPYDAAKKSFVRFRDFTYTNEPLLISLHVQ